ncbi:hypothetical protein NX773_15785 [Massilia solisilvae]|uniref:Apea-like HEPN domain-containing protein n=1 Tax=Massilia solisilvae TaxID=1811225 RepID=A0ABT2BM82_9BURK|nr:hypothetical protein [Massilia solisilvae]MCS0609628.1 hypothetical protein [Massilia solisilvae]
MSKSIAFLKFKVLLEREIRSFWHILASLEYAERWLQSHGALRLASSPGDNRYPFRAINITPDEFVSEQNAVRSHLLENTLVSFVTTFECFLAELLERVLYLNPSLLADSDVPFQARQLCLVVGTTDMRRWLAAQMTDKYLRNKTHKEMISRLDTLCKAGVSGALSSEIDEWTKWSLVRNSIVHTSRQVTEELSKAWPQRFPTARGGLDLTNEELARVHHLAIKIAQAIDVRAVQTRIGKHDELLLARELFVQNGMAEPSALVAALSHVGRVQVSKKDVERMLAAHKKGNLSDSWQLSVRDLKDLVG